jgi:hypothetical protein
MISLCFRRLWAENARLSARRFPSSPSAVKPALLMIMGVAVVGVVAKGKLSTGKGTKEGSKFRAWSPSLREENAQGGHAPRGCLGATVGQPEMAKWDRDGWRGRPEMKKARTQ